MCSNQETAKELESGSEIVHGWFTGWACGCVREREKETDRERERKMYIYIYTRSELASLAHSFYILTMLKKKMLTQIIWYTHTLLRVGNIIDYYW